MKLNLRGFVAGALCGAILIAAVWAGSVWWRPQLSPEDATVYDTCLAAQNGNAVACDAYMRIYQRVKAKDDALKKTLKEGGAKMLTEGHSKSEVVDWARGMGGVGQQLSGAAGISLRDLQDGKY
jgi:hypothetical protein